VLENDLWLSPLTVEDRNMFLELNSTDELAENNTLEAIPIQPEKTIEIPPTKIVVETKKINPEFIKMLSDEFVLLVRNLSPAIMDLSDAYAFQSVLKVHYLKFEHLAKACETIGLQGLAKVFKSILANIVAGCENTTSFNKNERTLFKESLLLIQMYIMDVTNDTSALTLVNHLQTNDWAFPLDNSQALSLIQLLSAVDISAEDNNKSFDGRKTTAESTDICLKLPEDVNQELLNSLLNELPILTANFSAIIQKIISLDPSLDHLLEAQRIAHTLKGSGNIVGITGIAVLTHHLEEILAFLTEKQCFPTKNLANSLLEAADCLEMMSDVILIGETEEPDNALQVLQSILDWSNKIFKEGLPEETQPLDVEINLPAATNSKQTVTVQTPKATETVEMTRVSSQLIDKLLRITGEESILREQFKERINHFSEELKTLNQLTGSMQTLVLELDQSVTLQSHSTHNKTINSEFDSLEMEQYNELHTAASRIAEVATDIRNLNITMDEKLIDLKYLMRDEEVVQKENQQILQSIRMVPVSTISSRCQRIVRQACRMTDKEIELTIQGNEVLIDSKILNGMIEPLMHLLRNAVDHGIESKALRQKNNKTKIGKINLEFKLQGNYIVIHCKDDGRGLSCKNILQTAIKKGLITKEDVLTKAEIYKLILMPGFSTRTNATQVSGRGIGMDVVQTKIASLQGQMSISSIEGEGLSIEISIPQILSSMLSLLVHCNGCTMAISNRGLEKIHHADDYQLLENNRCQVATQEYAACYFAELLGMPTTYDKTKKLPALQISDEMGKTYLVFVDELLGYRNLLVKDMGDYISHIQGVTGASILGNGEVAPVIDLVEMLHHAAKYDFLSIDVTKGMINEVGEPPMALVVDDSLSARRATVMLLEDYGLEVKTAIDGLDAIKQIEDKQPDIMLVDLEMPRMNGIELSAHLKGSKETKQIPIIMITSRATTKHRKQAKIAGVAKFMIKPFSEEALINNVNELINAL
jgi:chemosensory pili system protein ChpA (sensor histidine kinase/response regulator)